MRLPAKTEYACKAIWELCLRHNGKEPLALDEIAKAQKIPKEFLVQILTKLKNAKLVESVRGVEGGYYITQHPSHISVAQVIEAVDPDFMNDHLTRALSQGESESFIYPLWKTIHEDLKNVLSVTFENLIIKTRNKESWYEI